MNAVVYARVSTARQAETDLSIPDQVAQCEGYCKRHGLAVVNRYVEPGASATDDKRPVFQQMMGDAELKPRPFDTIIVHSFSRFFRDHFQMEFYVRKLAKLGIKLIAITQDVGNEPYSQMIRQILALFDEHQSRENGKHTKRAMQENARRGNHNGRPPFGFRHEGTGEVGNKGREKKRLVREESEVPSVQRIYDLYLNGIGGHPVGMSAIAVYLNARKMLRRGLPWRIQTVSQVLSNPIYAGEYCWNLRSGKDRKRNPEGDIIRSAVPAIVSEETYKAVADRRRARQPATAPARRLASPYLLSGLLTCGCCGSGMVVSTGTSKGGKVYAYYTCQRKLSQGTKACASRRLAVSKLDHLILTALAEQILVPARVTAILEELTKALAVGSGQDQAQLRDLQGRLKEADTGYQRLMDAIEKGILPLDEITRRRAQEHQRERAELLGEIGRIHARRGPPINVRSPKHIWAFTEATRNKLLDRESGFGRAYLGLLVNGIMVEPEKVTIKGNKTVLAAAIANMKLGAQGVHSSMPARDAIGDSNSGDR